MYDQTIGALLAESRFLATEELPDGVRSVLRTALARTPYLAGAPSRVLVPQELGDVAALFDYLIPRLVEGAETARQNAEELAALRADVAAFRRVLGVAQEARS